ncbi:hypothetical protein Ancab_028852, partial [Ancistrocladus abbreviatus]
SSDKVSPVNNANIVRDSGEDRRVVHETTSQGLFLAASKFGLIEKNIGERLSTVR